MPGAATTGSLPAPPNPPGSGGDLASRPLQWSVAGVSRTGRRPANEDSIHMAVPAAGGLVRAAASVCDGMGGHNAGEVASAMAVESLREWLSRPDALPGDDPASVEAAVRDWVVRTNAQILDATTDRPDRHGMGTTLAVALVVGERRLVIANVGDSRIFLVRGLRVTQVSVDHTVLAEQERLLGKDAPLLEDPSHSPFAHALTRSLGQQPDVEPDVRADLELSPGDLVILTSDGVTDVLKPPDLLSAIDAAAGIHAVAEEIYRRAFEAGSRDNISVVVLAAHAPEEAPAADPPPARASSPAIPIPSPEKRVAAPGTSVPPAEPPAASSPAPAAPAAPAASSPAAGPRSPGLPAFAKPARSRRARPSGPGRLLVVLGLLAVGAIGLTLALTVDWKGRPPVSRR